MTVEEFYEAINGDYAEVIGRLRKDERILKYLKLFLDDESYKGLEAALAANDYKAAFEHSHNLKGVCANLGLGELARSSSEICEELRGGNPGDGLGAMNEKVTEWYKKTVEKIGELG